MKIYNVYDAKAECYLTPIFFKTHALAIRAFENAINTPEHDFNRYSEDYTLFHIGDYDEDNGTITPVLTLVPLSKANELKKGTPE